MIKFEFWRGNELLYSEYPDTNSPAYKISLDLQKTFYQEGNCWSTEYSYSCTRTLDLQFRMENIVAGVVTYRSYKVLRDTNSNNSYEDW